MKHSGIILRHGKKQGECEITLKQYRQYIKEAGKHHPRKEVRPLILKLEKNPLADKDSPASIILTSGVVLYLQALHRLYTSFPQVMHKVRSNKGIGKITLS